MVWVDWEMKWYAISGSWRVADENLFNDVKNVVKEIVSKGDGIVSGGALGVDYIATQVVLDSGVPKKQLKIYLPIKLEALLDILSKVKKWTKKK